MGLQGGRLLLLVLLLLLLVVGLLLLVLGQLLVLMLLLSASLFVATSRARPETEPLPFGELKQHAIPPASRAESTC